jgi:hypothetical protein
VAASWVRAIVKHSALKKPLIFTVYDQRKLIPVSLLAGLARKRHLPLISPSARLKSRLIAS